MSADRIYLDDQSTLVIAEIPISLIDMTFDPARIPQKRRAPGARLLKARDSGLTTRD